MTTEDQLTEHQQALIEEATAYTRNFVLVRSAVVKALQQDSDIKGHGDTYQEMASEIAHIVLARKREDFFREVDKNERPQERLIDRFPSDKNER